MKVHLNLSVDYNKLEFLKENKINISKLFNEMMDEATAKKGLLKRIAKLEKQLEQAKLKRNKEEVVINF